jgi:signal peptidase I
MTATEASVAKPAAKDTKSEGGIGEIISTVLWALAITIVLRFFIVQPFTIPSASMYPTLEVGDYLVVSKWSYGYSKQSFAPLPLPLPKGRVFGSVPERGDVVVFRNPMQPGKDFIKRAVGLPGDRIQVKEGALYINDIAVPRERLDDTTVDGSLVKQYRETLPNGRTYLTWDGGEIAEDNTGVFVVPADHVFMMGDNRDDSSDSRFSSRMGYVPVDQLVGRARFVVASWEDAKLFNPVSWFTGFRTDRIFEGLEGPRVAAPIAAAEPPAEPAK